MELKQLWPYLFFYCFVAFGSTTLMYPLLAYKYRRNQVSIEALHDFCNNLHFPFYQLLVDPVTSLFTRGSLITEVIPQGTRNTTIAPAILPMMFILFGFFGFVTDLLKTDNIERILVNIIGLSISTLTVYRAMQFGNRLAEIEASLRSKQK